MQKKILILSLFCLLCAATVTRAEISCNKKILTKDEELICQSENIENLKYLDKMFETFEQMIRFMPEHMDFKQKNKEWRVERSQCETEECIRALYERLIQDAEEIIFANNTEYRNIREECQSLDLPQECETYVYRGGGLNVDFADFQIDPNMETHQKTIKVNRPGKCVNLILATFEPTVWKIKYFPTTKIKTVVLGKTRNYNQMVQGVEVGTKIYRDICARSDQQWHYFTGIKNLNIANSPIIGKEEEDSLYWYHPENIDVKAEIRQELANHEAVNQLVKEGVLRRITAKDKEFILKTGFSSIDTWNLPDFTFFNHQYCDTEIQLYTDYKCNYYFLDKPLKQLPRGIDGVYQISIFVPTDMEPPIKSHSPHNTSNIVRLHTTSEELQKYYESK